MKHIIVLLLVFSTVVLMTPNAFSQYVPEWVKNTAGWWSTDAISETEFVNAIEFLVKENIIQVNVTQTSETNQGVPEWVKNTAGWWSTDAISETEFVNAISYLIKVGIINIESSKSPELIAEMWINGHINDDEFLVNVDRLIETNRLSIPVNSVTYTSQIPDWLLNNAGWWTARIFTNSDFNFDPGYTDSELYPCIELSIDTGCIIRTYNSHSFRGAEFEKVKEHGVDFRIFAVGGSTTFGAASDDNQTWPAHLQKIIDDEITNQKIQVINAGMSGGVSESNYDLIKNKLSTLDPDLIIIYEGWNDSNTVPIEETIRNWESTCKLGNSKGFDTIILVQAMVSTGNRVMTVQEMTNSYNNFSYLQNSQQYVDAFEELDDVCTKVVDFRRIFDYVQEPVFWDGGHMMSFGNQIVAKNVFSLISPIYFDQKYSVIHNEPEAGAIYAVGADLSGKNFDNLNLQNAVFDKADLSNTSFKNANIDGARFVFANLDNSDLFDKADLSNVNLTGVDLQDIGLKGKDLSGANLSYVDLSEHDLSGANLVGATLAHAVLPNTGLKGKDLSGANLSYVDLSEHDLTGTNLTDVNLTHTKISNVSLKGKDLSGANLSYVDLSEHDLSGANLSDTFLLRTNLSGIDLRSIPLTNADFRYSDLSGTKLSDSLLVNNHFEHATLSNIDFAGKNLSGSSFNQIKLDGSDMQDTDLSKAFFIQVDFTKIKNKSLAGADLSYASFAHSNLSGVNLSNIILAGTNFWKADLSGVDFTVISNAFILGTDFKETNLSNSNFEGVNSETNVHTYTFKNQADRISDTQELMGGRNVIIISAEVSGNDLAVSYVFFNNFAHANLENVNFKNTNLWRANFYSADLTNVDLTGADLRNAYLVNADLTGADLTGADLRNAYLVNADLTGADLTGADLTGAVITEAEWDDGTILNCIGHPICLNE